MPIVNGWLLGPTVDKSGESLALCPAVDELGRGKSWRPCFSGGTPRAGQGWREEIGVTSSGKLTLNRQQRPSTLCIFGHTTACSYRSQIVRPLLLHQRENEPEIGKSRFQMPPAASWAGNFYAAFGTGWQPRRQASRKLSNMTRQDGPS